MALKYDLTGQVFGDLVVLGRGDGITSKRERLWRCSCSCGNIIETRGHRLRSGKKKTCRCSGNVGVKTHGRSRHKCSKGDPLYPVWALMRQRCNDPNHPSYEHYGGRGISICKEWDSFEQFAEDMGPKMPWESIDRIDNNGDYEPNNCRWAASKTQNNNRRNNRVLTHNGEAMTLSQWADRIGISYSALWCRLSRGQSLSAVISHFSEGNRRVLA